MSLIWNPDTDPKALTCYRCAKIIRGEATRHVPPEYLIRMGLDFCKAFHPACYEMEETDAATNLEPGRR